MVSRVSDALSRAPDIDRALEGALAACVPEAFACAAIFVAEAGAPPRLAAHAGFESGPPPGLRAEAGWVEECPRELGRAAGLGALVVAPLVAGGERLGALFLGAPTEPSLEAVRLAVARPLAAAVASALALGRARARDVLLAKAVHALRQPLMSLELRVENALATVSHPSVAAEALGERLGGIRGQLGRMGALLDTLSEASRISCGRLELVPEELDLAAIAREAVERRALDALRAECSVELRAGTPVLGLWDRRIRTAIAGLLDNALRHAFGTPVRVTVSGSEGTARLIVQDHGRGVPPEDEKRIQERFERLIARKTPGGLGLGLWLTRHIVEASGGSLIVAPTPGGGATFTVELPR